MRTGILVASICVAWAETVTFATWNVLSIPKCSQKANGFPYFKENALKLHNSLSCGGKEYVFDIGTKMELHQDVGGLESCHGTWISGQVEKLFADEEIDILVAQEIDYFHFKGIQRMMGDGGKFQMTQLSSKPLEAVEEELRKSLVAKNPIPADLPFVIWDKNKISGIECFALEGWPKGVGECAYTTPSKSRRRFIGMHAGGNNGFNVKEAKLIGRRTDIDVVLGDFNLHAVATVTAAVQTIEPFLKVAMPAEERSATVYRFVHPARKLFQAFDNDWRKGLNKETGETIAEFKCDNVLKNTVAYTKTKLNETGETVNDVDKDGKLQTGYKVPQSLKVFELKDKSVTTYIEMCEALKKLQAGPTSTEENNPPKEDKLVKELKDLDKIGDTKIDYTFDWTRFPQKLGLTADLVMTDEAAKYVSMEDKQEDFIAYNQDRFNKPSALVIVKEEVLRPMADENRKMEKKGIDSSHMKHFPIEVMASDHLPVVLRLEKIKKKTRDDFEITPTRKATDLQKAKRRKALKNILAEEVPRTKANKILEQYDNGQLDVRQALRAGRLAKEKTCWEIIKGWFTTAKSASIRRKLDGTAPTMGKLLKALKRVSQRMKKGERAA